MEVGKTMRIEDVTQGLQFMKDIQNRGLIPVNYQNDATILHGSLLREERILTKRKSRIEINRQRGGCVK